MFNLLRLWLKLGLTNIEILVLGFILLTTRTRNRTYKLKHFGRQSLIFPFLDWHKDDDDGKYYDDHDDSEDNYHNFLDVDLFPF